MSLKYFTMVGLLGVTALTCAAIPQDQGQAKTATSTITSCEMKPERKVASCDPSNVSSEAKTSLDQVTSIRRSRETFHRGGRQGL